MSTSQTTPQHAEESFGFTGDNVWLMAEKLAESERLRGGIDSQHSESTLLFVGSKNSGKSTLIHKFLDRHEVPSKTLGLEYCYGRKSGKGVMKDVCHIWELGGGTTHTSLLHTPLKAESLSSLSIVLAVDLTRPDEIWITLETMIEMLHKTLQAVISSDEGNVINLKQRLQDSTDRRVPSDHPDHQWLNRMPVPLIIIGCKYDGWQDMDSETRRTVCRALRYMAHRNGADLVFFSVHDGALVRKTREMISHHAFNTPTSGQLSQDYNKPLLIPAGADSMAVILGVGADFSYTAIKNAYNARHSQVAATSTVLPDDPGSDPSYRNASVDQRRAHKDQELQILRAEMERNSRWGDQL